MTKRNQAIETLRTARRIIEAATPERDIQRQLKRAIERMEKLRK